MGILNSFHDKYELKCDNDSWYIVDENQNSVKMFVDPSGNTSFGTHNDNNLKIIVEKCDSKKLAKSLFKEYAKRKYGNINQR